MLPSLVLHAGGNALDGLMSIGGAGAEGQRAAAQHGGGGGGGAGGAGLAVNLIVLAATGAATLWACRELARAMSTSAPPA